MRDLKDKRAVITGGASGIGLAIARRLAREGARLVLVDLRAPALEEAAATLRSEGHEVAVEQVDVSDFSQVAQLAKRLHANGGCVDVLCNNAGVGMSDWSWQHTPEDWKWVLGVNLHGVIHGIHAFVPAMLARGGEGHILNTASVAGLGSTPFLAAYNVSKHGVVTLSETLHHELAVLGSELKVSVLCPGFVTTNLADAPARREAARSAPPQAARPDAMQEMLRAGIAEGIPAEQVAEQALAAILEERLHVLTHPEVEASLRHRAENIIAGNSPTDLRRWTALATASPPRTHPGKGTGD